MKPEAKRFTEAKLVDDLAEWLKAIGYQVRTEVALLGQSVDVVATKGHWITLMEAKVSDWQRALRQCESHDMVADYICIVIASVHVAEDLKIEASRRGYGIIHYSRTTGALSWVCQPTRNTRVWLPQRKAWLAASNTAYGN